MKVLLSVALLILASTFSMAQDTPDVKCPTVSVTGPAGIVGVGELAPYTVQVSNAEQYSLEYVWSISAGRIKDGQGTNSIRVIQPNTGVTATVELKGLPEGCPAIVSETSIGDPAPDPIMFYELEPNAFFTARSVAAEMLENRNNQLYILAGDVGRKNSPAFRKKQQTIIDLLSEFGVTRDRITIETVYSDVELFQFWRVPPGASNPKCEECDELEKARKECPEITVTGPASVVEPGEDMTFVATVTGSIPERARYSWSIDGGSIVDGQGTLKLTAHYPRSTKPTVTVTATLTMLGLPDDCPRTAAAMYAVACNCRSILIDEFSRLPLGKQAGRLDNAVAELRKHPTSKLHVIQYFPGNASEQTVGQRGSWISAQLKRRKVLPKDFEIVTSRSTSGYPFTSIYIVPPGAENPTP